MRVIKFEASNCAPCSMVGNWLNNNNVEHEVYNISKGGAQEFLKYKVKSVPTVIGLNDENEEVVRVMGFKPDELVKIAQ